MEVSVIMADRPITTTASRLMALPGELRNRIYKAITDDEGPKETRLWRPRPCGQFPKVRNPGLRYLGLGQTNCMFRSEFMPLYVTARRTLIAIEDVPYYLEAFPLTDPALTASIITVLRDLLSVFRDRHRLPKSMFFPFYVRIGEKTLMLSTPSEAYRS
ncbi:unnamed protein product [Alternaria alternata]